MRLFPHLDLEALEKRLGVSFRSQRLLEEALVHPSFLNENPSFPLDSNQRLEFLGDAVISLVTALALFKAGPRCDEGTLTRFRSHLIQRRTLARVSEELGLGTFLVLGRGEEATGGRRRESNLAALYEALMGALFLDQGYRAARQLVLRTLKREIQDVLRVGIPQEPKSRLQEVVQGKGWPTPHYRVVEATGPEHGKRFVVEVCVEQQVLGRGEGRSKVEAEREAAQAALRALGDCS